MKQTCTITIIITCTVAVAVATAAYQGLIKVKRCYSIFIFRWVSVIIKTNSECNVSILLSNFTASAFNPFGELGACKMPVAQLLDYLGQIFSFLYSVVLCGDEKVRWVNYAFVTK